MLKNNLFSNYLLFIIRNKSKNIFINYVKSKTQ